MGEAKRRKSAKSAKILHGLRPKVPPSVDRKGEQWQAPGTRKFEPDRPVPPAVSKDKRQGALALVPADVPAPPSRAHAIFEEIARRARPSDC